jgi:hypothetical protein
MAFIMPEVVLQRVVQQGIANLRENQDAFNDIFLMYTADDLNNDYGQAYIDKIWTWFTSTKIPVVQAWSFNADRIPCISLHLASESEDESKAAMGDHFGMGEGSDVNFDSSVGVFTVNVDIGIHGDRTGDMVLWMYYIMSYILYKEKLVAERLGLMLHTWSASDYNKESKYMGENIWTRWIRFRCTTQNLLEFQQGTEIEEVESDVDYDNPNTNEDGTDSETQDGIDYSRVD